MQAKCVDNYTFEKQNIAPNPQITKNNIHPVIIIALIIGTPNPEIKVATQKNENITPNIVYNIFILFINPPSY